MGAAALIDSPNGKAVQYRYDAWGRPLEKTGCMANTLGTYNPFRYRHYVYDEETGQYDLRSRYYNPVWGRFICADSLLGKFGKLLSHNLFAYCGNNPVNRSDSNGFEEVRAALPTPDAENWKNRSFNQQRFLLCPFFPPKRF